MPSPNLRRWAAAALLAAAPLLAQGRLEPLDLKLIPADAHAFVAVRPGPLWEHPGLKQSMAGLTAAFARGKYRVVDPKQITEFAAFVFDGGKESAFRLVAKDASAFDGVKKNLKGEPTKVAGREGEFTATDGWLADGDALLLGKQDTVLRVAKPKAGEPAWADLLGSERAPIVFALDVPAVLTANPLPPIPVPDINEFVAALGQAKAVAGRIKLDGDDAALEAVAECRDAAAATALADAANGVLDFAKAQLAQVPPDVRKNGGPGFDLVELLAPVEKFLESAKAKADGKQVTLTARMPAASALAALGAAQGAAARTVMANNLKQIGLALHNYHDAHGTLPAAQWKGPDGNAKHAHSWRVAILPFIEEQKLYDEYKLDEPWDSDANKAVLAKMPDIFRHPDDQDAKDNHWTNVFALVGDGAAWEKDKGVTIREFADGTSNTVLLVAAKRKLPWTKPDDIDYEKKGDLPELGGHDPGGWSVVLADCSVRFISDKVEEKSWRAMITRAGGEAP